MVINYAKVGIMAFAIAFIIALSTLNASGAYDEQSIGMSLVVSTIVATMLLAVIAVIDTIN